MGIRYLEPYLYAVATKEIDDVDYIDNTDVIVFGSHINESSNEYKAFEIAIKNLISKIENIIKDREKLIGKKIEELKDSSSFYDDFGEILLSVKGVNETQLKDTLAEYSKPFATGSRFNDYL